MYAFTILLLLSTRLIGNDEAEGDDNRILAVQEVKASSVVPLDQPGVISIFLQDADVVTVMKGIAQIGNYDFVTKGEIAKTVNLTLKGRSIRESLDIISDSTNTEYRLDGTIITVFGDDQDPSYTQTYSVLKGNTLQIADLLRDLIGATVSQVAQPGTEGAQQQQSGTREPISKGNARLGVDKLNGQIVVTAVPSDHRKVEKVFPELDMDKPPKRYTSRMFELKFISPDIFRKSVKFLIPGIDDTQILTFLEGTGGGSGQALSAAQKRIVIQETPSNIQRIEELLQKIDTPPRQVVIDVKMIEFTLKNDEKLGVDWKSIFTASGRNLPVGEFFSPLANTSTGGRIKFGSLGPDHVQIILDFVKTYSQAKVLSNPQITALDGFTATIKVGDEIPYRTSTVNQGVIQSTVNFKTAGVELVVTPVIFKNDFVNIAIKPIISSRNGEFDGVPIVSTKETDTTLNIRNNHTIIMGGLISHSNSTEASELPVLGRIPGIGKFFRRDGINSQSTELVFLITPKIYSEFEEHPHDKLEYRFDDEAPVGNVPYHFVDTAEAVTKRGRK